MKKLLLLLLCVPLIGFGQIDNTEYKSILPFDSLTNLVTFEEVIEYEGVNSDNLYTSLKEWIVTSTFWKSDYDGFFINTSNIREVEEIILQMDNREGRKLIAKGRTKIKHGGMSAYHNYTLKIYIREGRFKYIITNIVLDGGISSGVELSWPLEEYYTGYSKKGRLIKWQLKYHKSIIEFADRIGNDIKNQVKIIINSDENDDW